MKNLLLLFLLVLPSISFCQSSSGKTSFSDAVEYNYYIVSEQTAIGNEINKLMAIAYDSTSTYEQAEAQRKVLASRAAEAERNVKNMPDWKGNTSFRDAAAELFHFYYNTFEIDYKRLVELFYKEDEVWTESDSQEMQDIRSGITEKEKGYDEKFISEEEQFAKENNFTLLPNENQK
jgi:hypothetical protein